MTVTTDAHTFIGSLLTTAGPRPFVFDYERGQLELDKYAPRAELRLPLEAEKDAVIFSLRATANVAIEEVRFGEYFCTVCKNGVRATPNEWSTHQCMSCSLDQGTEMGEFFAAKAQEDEILILCPYCLFVVPETAAFCPHCALDMRNDAQHEVTRAELAAEKTKTCPHCRAAIPSLAVICGKCRANLGGLKLS